MVPRAFPPRSASRLKEGISSSLFREEIVERIEKEREREIYRPYACNTREIEKVFFEILRKELSDNDMDVDGDMLVIYGMAIEKVGIVHIVEIQKALSQGKDNPDRRKLPKLCFSSPPPLPSVDKTIGRDDLVQWH